MSLLMRIPVPWVFVLSYLLGAALEYVFPSHPNTPWSAPILVSGGILFAIGAVIAGWSLVIFRTRRTTTVPGQVSSTLVTWGPYRLSRNPMYVGLFFAYVGEACLLKHLWPLLLLPFLAAYLNWAVIPVEEKRLADRFPVEYNQYRATVRRWI